MTDKEKARFLKSEGWIKLLGFSEVWEDPCQVSDETWLSRDDAFKKATRRKSARDSRRLKAAGWIHGVLSAWNLHPRRTGWWHPKHPSYHTKAEALSTLEET
jgi:hypothetical protein